MTDNDIEFGLCLCMATMESPNADAFGGAIGWPMNLALFTSRVRQVMQTRFGHDVGIAYALLICGGFGISGVADRFSLASVARDASLSSDGKVFNLTMDVAKASLAAKLRANAAPALQAAGLTADSVARAAALIVGLAD